MRLHIAEVCLKLLLKTEAVARHLGHGAFASDEHCDSVAPHLPLLGDLDAEWKADRFSEEILDLLQQRGIPSLGLPTALLLRFTGRGMRGIKWPSCLGFSPKESLTPLRIRVVSAPPSVLKSSNMEF